MAKVVFLGTNGWFDSPTGNTVCTLVVTKEYNIVLDAGNGISKLPRYLDDAKPTYLFISHFHLDHVEGLHTLCLNRFSKGLNIVVQEGGTQILKTLMKLPYTIPLESMQFQTRIIEIGGGAADLPFTASFMQLLHTPYSLGMRLEADGKVIAHCLDTGYCENAVALGRDADLLILECTLRKGDIREYHLCPEHCARIAKESGARTLALTHFEGMSYPDMESRNESGELVKSMFPNSVICVDSMEIDITLG